MRALIYSTLSSISTPVYNAVLKSTNPPYVFIGSQTFVESSAKDTRMGEHTINIDVVSIFTEDYGGDKVVNDITSEIQELLDGIRGEETDNFYVITHKIDTSGMLYQTNGAERIVRQITTVRNLVQQKN